MLEGIQEVSDVPPPHPPTRLPVEDIEAWAAGFPSLTPQILMDTGSQLLQL
jgi:hypothetical protein